MIKTELWSSGEDKEDVKTGEESLTEGLGVTKQGEQWHFQNALFEDIRNTTITSSKASKSNMNSSMSRRRYSCLACGEVKRWDQLTQHYKVR